jgi:hypothetical protein
MPLPGAISIPFGIMRKIHGLIIWINTVVQCIIKIPAAVT